MIVAGLQIDTAWEDPPESLRRADELAARAAGAGARLVVLPEMFATGFSMAAERVAAHADAIRDGLAAMAMRHGVWAIGGYAEPGLGQPGLGPTEGDAADGADLSADRRPRNACSIFDPTGVERLRYHKIHPFTHAGEHEHYAGGEKLPTAEIEAEGEGDGIGGKGEGTGSMVQDKGLRVTPLICYDLRFPEPFRAAAGRTDLFVVVANWPVARRDAWRTLLRARAIENQTFVLGVNRVGEGDGLAYGGDSALIDPYGATIASAAEQPGIVVGDASAAAVTEARERFGFLADRRGEVYRRL